MADPAHGDNGAPSGPDRSVLLIGVGLAGALLLAGCGRNPSRPEPVWPSRLEVLSGDNQTAAAGAGLAALEVRVTDTRSRPLAGITVRWTVTAGGGTVEPGESETDTNGAARTRWTLGSSVGEHLLQAAVTGLEPVLLRAQAVAGTPASLQIHLGDGQTATAATRLPLDPTIVLRDSLGNPCPGVEVRFDVAAGDGWVPGLFVRTGPDGRARTVWYLGPVPGVTNLLRVTCGDLAVEFTAGSVAPTPGAVLYGRNAYIEYVVGDMPLVLSAPHGGYLYPDEIADRTWGTSGRDVNTQEMARTISDAFAERFAGDRPHLIICHLARIKLDANRDILEAAQGDSLAQWAWFEYHRFIDAAEAVVTADFGRGFYIDLHGHSHPVARLELGYLISNTDLKQTDEVLDGSYYIDKCSIRNLALTSPLSLSDLLRGSSSLGTLLEAAGIPAVPSSPQPDAGAEPFYSAGYNTERHGSRDGGVVDGVQIELHYPGIRDTAENRLAFSHVLAEVMEAYLQVHYGLLLSSPAGPFSLLPAAAPRCFLFRWSAGTAGRVSPLLGFSQCQRNMTVPEMMTPGPVVLRTGAGDVHDDGVIRN